MIIRRLKDAFWPDIPPSLEQEKAMRAQDIRVSNNPRVELRKLRWEVFEQQRTRWVRLLLCAVLFFSILFFISGFTAGRELFPRCAPEVIK